MRPSRLAVLASACALTACAPPPGGSAGGTESAARAVSGCYRFTGGLGLGLPWGVQLVDRPLEGRPALPEGRLARSFLAPSEVADHPFGYWEDAAGDSIRIGYPAGGSLTLVLAFDGATLLTGRGSAAGDAVPLGQPARVLAASVAAERVACPAD